MSTISERLRERHRVDSERMWPAPSDLDLLAADRIDALEKDFEMSRTSPVTERDKLWHLIAKHIACESDCQKWPNGCGCAQNAADAVIASFGFAQTGQQRIAAPGNDQLSKLWNAIVENTKGDGFWIGEILLTTLEREVGFNPAALTDTSTGGNGK